MPDLDHYILLISLVRFLEFDFSYIKLNDGIFMIAFYDQFQFKYICDLLRAHNIDHFSG